MEYKKSWKVGESVTIGAKTLRNITTAAAKIGDNAVFLSNSIVYDGVNIGNSLIIGHNAIIREENVIGDNFKLWNNSVVDYGCRIGNNVKVHCNCYIAQFTKIEDDVFIAPGAITTNDKYPGRKDAEKHLKGPTIKKGAQIGAGSVIMPGVTIGANSIIGAGSVVTKDIPADVVAYGNPARVAGKRSELYK